MTSAQRATLLAFPTEEDELIRHYTFSTHDLAVIRQHRGAHNRLGFAVQLCYLRYPGRALMMDEAPYPPLLGVAAASSDKLTRILDRYDTAPQRQPLSANTRRAYRVRVHQYSEYLKSLVNEYGDPLQDLHARDYAVCDYKMFLKTRRRAKPRTVNLSLAAYSTSCTVLRGPSDGDITRLPDRHFLLLRSESSSI